MNVKKQLLLFDVLTRIINIFQYKYEAGHCVLLLFPV